MRKTKEITDLPRPDISDGMKAHPKPALRMIDAIALIVGIVVGAGIFRTPSLVAANTASSSMFLLIWVLGRLPFPDPGFWKTPGLSFCLGPDECHSNRLHCPAGLYYR
jgi:hypothetical protein